ncbi:hypothetical protein CDD83_11058 [Cordyceps sp. RAO-2017]|nr:hypothetical protein CDD83_11058 [Cordyceps sp. RAO-2017]
MQKHIRLSCESSVATCDEPPWQEVWRMAGWLSIHPSFQPCRDAGLDSGRRPRAGAPKRALPLRQSPAGQAVARGRPGQRAHSGRSAGASGHAGVAAPSAPTAVAVLLPASTTASHQALGITGQLFPLNLSACLRASPAPPPPSPPPPPPPSALLRLRLPPHGPPRSVIASASPLMSSPSRRPWRRYPQ